METCIAKDLLSSKHIKKTEQRLNILNEIILIKHPFNANELHNRLKNKFYVDLATIYRVLNILLKYKIIREVMILDGLKYYELSCIHNPVHPHLYCEECHKIICLNSITFDESLQILKLKNEHIIKNVSINLNGICKNCWQSMEIKNGKE